MLVQLFTVVFLISLAGAQEIGSNNSLSEKNSTNSDERNSPIPADIIGNLVLMLSNVVASSLRRSAPPKDEVCEPFLIHYGNYEMKFGRQPRGSCPYCCRLINPARHIRLYLTSTITPNKTTMVSLARKAGTLENAGINNKMRTIIYIHGFTEHGQGGSAKTIRDAYCARNESYNIILVDWGDLCVFPWYVQAAKNTVPAAWALTKFLKFYDKTGELPISTLHLIGFSLGAHVSGFIGKALLKSGQKLSRITALDPAFPLFPLGDTTKRITESDADYVDVIHTDPGILGMPISVGHADFYPNGDKLSQPGCTTSQLAENNVIYQIGTCNHLRAWHFYAESVKNPSAFPATKCDASEPKLCRFNQEGYMGFPATMDTCVGDFYLVTNENEPFGRSIKEQPEMDTSKFVHKYFNRRNN